MIEFSLKRQAKRPKKAISIQINVLFECKYKKIHDKRILCQSRSIFYAYPKLNKVEKMKTSYLLDSLQ